MPKKVLYTVRDNETYLTDNVVSLTIHGEPKPEARPRVVHQRRSPRGNKGKVKSKNAPPPIRVYNPSTTDKQSFQYAAVQAVSGVFRGQLPLFGGNHPIDIPIPFYFKRPLWHFLGGVCAPLNLKEEHRNDFPFHIGGDADNHLKFVLDALEGVVYKNDRQVVNITIQKNYTNTDDTRTELFCIAGGYEPVIVL